ncbi:hypothetical protein H8S90_14610 [Olivibacter sp. SDN3]|uniref:helix-turn-helix transcriptional regulator n=1 Tax=Olivibacter sp. SDN3 TaxID=2764720 RepID=UPI0016510FE8|nr:hypothetical protein [Olivibacter sp. SDN3]QNL48037.1 hypothetical protein H8S90_14610 [Olivibacter sp. SDN3]
MKNRISIVYLMLLLLNAMYVSAQHISDQTAYTLERIEKLLLKNQSLDALDSLENAIAVQQKCSDDLAYLYAYQSGIYISLDSLLLSKRALDLSMENAAKAKSNEAKAVAYRAKAFLNNYLNSPDEVVKDAIQGLKYLGESNKDLITKYFLNYLLYSAYSKWNDEKKMENYIRQCEKYAVLAKNDNLLANVNNGLSSMFLARYRAAKKRDDIDSSFHYLEKSFAIHTQSPENVSATTFVITCINLANYFLEFSDNNLLERKKKAFFYLAHAEEELKNNSVNADKWVSIFGIKSDFALKENNIPLAEQYLLQGLTLIQQNNNTFFKQEYTVYKHLADIAVKKGDLQSALNYQRKAENSLKQTFDQLQIFNAQKLEIQYETEKKNQQLKLLNERAELRKQQTYLYGGIALALVIGLGFMFLSYHFKLRYSIEREKKLAQEKEDAERSAAMQMQLEKEEQARLKAEQELLELQRQQLQKEALANSLIIEHKNDMFKQIQTKLKEGDARNIQKLLKEEMLMNTDFEDIRWQIQQLHPNFFHQLSEKAVQKLTPLDLKYCAYIHLQMSTKQIAQVLHVEAQSVRMFKYRLKQKFGLSKESNLEIFLQDPR